MSELWIFLCFSFLFEVTVIMYFKIYIYTDLFILYYTIYSFLSCLFSVIVSELYNQYVH